MDSEQKTEAPFDGKTADEVSVHLSRQRTTLSFQRTRVSADRTLMSVIRTALSLIGFGFTIFQFFRSLKGMQGVQSIERLKKDPHEIASDLGMGLVGLGILMLFLGIIYHALFMKQIRNERNRLNLEGLIIAHDEFPISMTLIIAFLLFVLGIYVITKMVVAIHG